MAPFNSLFMNRVELFLQHHYLNEKLIDVKQESIRFKGMCVDDDDDVDVFSNSSNYLQDSNQSKIPTVIIIIKRELKLQE